MMKISNALLFVMLFLQGMAPAPAELLKSHWEFIPPHPGDASIQQDDAGILKITVTIPCEPFWKIGATQTVIDDLPRDHVLQFTFRARSTTRNPIRAIVEQVQDPYATVISVSPTLTPEWQDFQVQGTTAGFGTAGVGVRFQAGQQAGTIEIADIHLRDLGVDPVVTTASSDLLTPRSWEIGSPHPGDATMRHLDDGSLAITVTKPCDPIWNITTGQTIANDLLRDHVLQLNFRARSPTRNPMRAVVEQTQNPYATIALVDAKLTPDWQTYEIKGNSAGFGRGGVGVHFQMGRQAGTIEIADVHLRDLGTDPAIISANDAIQPAAIAQRIEKYRKRTVQFHIHDADDRPLSGVQVQVNQTRHAFLFGCNCYELDVASKDPLQLQYQDRFAELFNYATLPFYWAAYETSAGHTDEARLRAMATWCRDHHITTKGHPLIYTLLYPGWASKEVDPAKALLHARVSDTISRFDGLINIWDVVNEANDAPHHLDTGVGAWADRDGAPQMVGTALQWARAVHASQGETFLDNDYDSSAKNVQLLQWLSDHQQLPDAIGMQSHMHAANWRLQDIWATAEHFSKFSRPIHFTETTVLSGPHRTNIDWSAPYATDWKTTPTGEAEQAAYVVQFYSILFSHPALQAITWWDFSDRNAWLGAPAGLLRPDNTPKPAYHALMKLIHHDWWTREQLDTDATGNCHSRVFCGDYVIKITDKAGHVTEKAVTISPGASDLDFSLRASR